LFQERQTLYNITRFFPQKNTFAYTVTILVLFQGSIDVLVIATCKPLVNLLGKNPLETFVDMNINGLDIRKTSIHY